MLTVAGLFLSRAEPSMLDEYSSRLRVVSGTSKFFKLQTWFSADDVGRSLPQAASADKPRIARSPRRIASFPNRETDRLCQQGLRIGDA